MNRLEDDMIVSARKLYATKLCLETTTEGNNIVCLPPCVHLSAHPLVAPSESIAAVRKSTNGL
jgi:hypothetical protein